MSPVVLMIFSSKLSFGKAARHWARTRLAWASANALPRVAMAMGGVEGMGWE